jgi:hypothetical protein
LRFRRASSGFVPENQDFAHPNHPVGRGNLNFPAGLNARPWNFLLAFSYLHPSTMIN